MVDSAYFVKSTPLRAFAESIQYFADMLQTYWMCMKKYDAEMFFFWQIYWVFNFKRSSDNCT